MCVWYSLLQLDGDTRGGSALSVQGVSGKPVKFVGVGERLEDLEPFYPDRMAGELHRHILQIVRTCCCDSVSA